MFAILAVCLVNYLYYSLKDLSPSRSVPCLLVMLGVEEEACGTKQFLKYSLNFS